MKWQEHCTGVLRGILDRSDLTQSQKAAEWQREKVQLAQKQRVIVADLRCEEEDFTDFDFSFVYLARVNFLRSKLIRTKFKRAIFLDCSVRGSDLDGAAFWLADTKDLDLAEVKNFGRADLNTNTPITERNNARPLLVYVSNDHRYRNDLLDSGLLGWFGKLILRTDFGSRIWPTILSIAVLNALFAIGYLLTELAWPATFAVAGKPNGVIGFWSMFLMALQRFANAPPLIDSSNVIVGYFFELNAIAGLLTFGVFIAQITKRIILSAR